MRQLLFNLLLHVAFLIPDKLYIKIIYRLKNSYALNLKDPKTFNEKLQWLKLYNRRPEYTMMVDKYAVKGYVASLIGEQYIIPTFGVWDKFDEIDFDILPDSFVLKTTNGGGTSGVVICNDKSTLDIAAARRKLNKSLKSSIYARFKEWPYKNVKPRIIAEQYLQEQNRKDLTDYKFYCFDGQAKFCQVIKNRTSHETIDFFDRNWHHQSFIGLNPKAVHSPNEILKPDKLDEMINIADVLSVNIPFVRVDLYNVNGKIYFGEMTFFPASGFGLFSPNVWDSILGKYIELPAYKGSK